MAEQYKRFYHFKEDIFFEGSPLIIEAGALLNDIKNHRILAQLKLKNIARTNIQAVAVKLKLYNSLGESVGGLLHEYRDLNVKYGDSFGQQEAIHVDGTNARCFEASVEKVVFKDGNTWSSNNTTTIKMPAMEELSTRFQDPSVLQMYQESVGTRAKYVPIQMTSIWRCSCGAYNQSTESKCNVCAKGIKEQIEALDIDRLYLNHKEKVYVDACKLLEQGKSEEDFWTAGQFFASISDYKDAKEFVVKCEEIRKEQRNNRILAEAKAKMTRETISGYEAAITMFQSIPGWKDADEKIDACKQKIEEINVAYEKAAEERERKREEAEHIKKRNKKIAIIATPIVCAMIIFVIILNTVIIPNDKYNDAIALMDVGKIDEAYRIFNELGDYKDAADKAGDIRLTKTKKQLKNIRVGSYIKFGAYEQDNNTSNGKEDIEWLVLEVKDGKMLVISKYALDCQPYNTSFTNVTWATCTLRQWLNNDFTNSAFSADEKAMIPTVAVSADKNSNYSTDPGNPTQDQVFLLSIYEANKYFSFDHAWQCKATDYAEANGAYAIFGDDNCLWWMRSPGYSQKNAALVNNVGNFIWKGHNVNYDHGAVRPALWINLNP